jgi:hypothetical protein
LPSAKSLIAWGSFTLSPQPLPWCRVEEGVFLLADQSPLPKFIFELIFASHLNNNHFVLKMTIII